MDYCPSLQFDWEEQEGGRQGFAKVRGWGRKGGAKNGRSEATTLKFYIVITNNLPRVALVVAVRISRPYTWLS